jgi:hypothetical protein
MSVLGGHPVIKNTAGVDRAAQPVLERLGTLAAETVASVDLALDGSDAVYAVVATTAVPGAEEMIAGSSYRTSRFQICHIVRNRR